MKYRNRWWQFWRPVCVCTDLVETRRWIEEDMPSGGPNSNGSFMMATGDWLWIEYQCKDCGKTTKDGGWA